MSDLFSATPPRGTIDRNIGKGNGAFLGHVANGVPRDELVRRWKSGEFPDLHAGLAQEAMGSPHPMPKAGRGE